MIPIFPDSILGEIADLSEAGPIVRFLITNPDLHTSHKSWIAWAEFEAHVAYLEKNDQEAGFDEQKFEREEAIADSLQREWENEFNEHLYACSLNSSLCGQSS